MNKVLQVTPKQIVIALLAIFLVGTVYNALFTSSKKRSCQAHKSNAIIENPLKDLKHMGNKAVQGVKDVGNVVVDGAKIAGETVLDGAKIVGEKTTGTVQNIAGIGNNEEVVETETETEIADATAEVKDVTVDAEIEATDENVAVVAEVVGNDVPATTTVTEIKKIVTEVEIILNLRTPDGKSLTGGQPVIVNAAAPAPTAVPAPTEIVDTKEVEEAVVETATVTATETEVAAAPQANNEMTDRIDAKIDALIKEIENLKTLKNQLNSLEK